ncbi:lanthionine synthetase C family protein [Streptomyces sp. NPDC005828]|uniref:lanthionine synthetase C family protein n=1 Tax=Streptomyces sp. NPDC005828 TaxID=3157071 RepID=UPI0033D83C78
MMERDTRTADVTELLDPPSRSRITAEVEDAHSGTAEYVLHAADYTRTDRLWPAEPEVFATNPMSIAHGACGPAVFLHSASDSLTIPSTATAWMLDQPLRTENYPPGLYFGLAGVACALHRLGHHEKAAEAMAEAYASPLLFREPGMLLGCSGWGLASLHLFLKAGEPRYLDWAVRAGDHLLETAQRDQDTLYWHRAEDGRVHYGFGHGASGIALFLLHLHTVTGSLKFRDAAVKAMNYDLDRRTENDLGWNWQRFKGDTLIRPYWIQGTAGIGSVVIRFHQALHGAPESDSYLQDARRIAQDSFIKCTAIPGLFEGIAGIGEFMLDMYLFTGDDMYFDRALDLADTIMWFKIKKPHGIAWPGRWLDKVSADYASGSAGIGLFLSRLLRPRERFLMDLAPIGLNRSKFGGGSLT